MTNERVKKLKKGLLTKSQALEKIASYEDCEELSVQGKTGFAFHPSLEDHFVLDYKKKEYVLNLNAFTKLCRLTGVPSTYVKKIPQQLLFPHLNYWLGEGEVETKAFLHSGVDKDGRQAISSFAKGDAYYYPISRILTQIDRVNSDYLLEGLGDISWRNSSFGVVFPEFEFNVENEEMKVGDYLYGGIKVKNSLLSEFPLKISAFLMTLVCLNGLISADEVYPFNRKIGFEGQDAWVMDGVKQSFAALSAEVDKVSRLTQVPVSSESIPVYVSCIFDQRGVNVKTREAILGKIIELHPTNMYQLMNAVTQTCHTIENRGEVYALQSLGGYIVSHNESCPKCRRPF